MRQTNIFLGISRLAAVMMTAAITIPTAAAASEPSDSTATDLKEVVVKGQTTYTTSDGVTYVTNKNQRNGSANAYIFGYGKKVDRWERNTSIGGGSSAILSPTDPNDCSVSFHNWLGGGKAHSGYFVIPQRENRVPGYPLEASGSVDGSVRMPTKGNGI